MIPRYRLENPNEIIRDPEGGCVLIDDIKEWIDDLTTNASEISRPFRHNLAVQALRSLLDPPEEPL